MPADDGRLATPNVAVQRDPSEFPTPFRLGLGPFTWGSGLLVVIFIGAVTALGTGEFSRKEQVDGVLAPEVGAAEITSFRAGVITSVRVKTGDYVAANSPIAILSQDAVVEGGSSSAQLAAAIQSQSDALLTRAAASRASAKAEQETVILKRARTAASIKKIESEEALIETQVQAARETVDAARPAEEKGFISKLQFKQWESALAQAQLQLLEVRERLAEAKTELDQSEIDLRKASATASANDAQGILSGAQLAEKKVSASGQNLIVIVAPKSGRIAQLSIRAGEAIPSGARIATIVPDGSPIIAELKVPSRAIGFIQPGEQVRIMYDSFPFQKFGMGAGQVVSVDTAPQPQTPNDKQDVFFKVRVKCTRQSVFAFGRDWPLRPGMTLKANIILERRSLLEWLFEPLLRAHSI